MRALVVVNPRASTTTERIQEVLLDAISHRVQTVVATTAHRGHATELARKARIEGVDLVVSIGGDGTVNEVVNGLLADGPGPDVPAYGMIPGGSTNVFARNLGIPAHPVEATGFLLESLRKGRRTRVGLGTAGDRYFTFAAGVGLDAGVTRAVEDRRRDGARANALLYARAGMREYFAGTDRRNPALSLRWPGHEQVDGVFLAIVTNTAPWTYLGDRPVQTSPEASFDRGLDLVGVTRLGPVHMAGHMAQLALGRRGVRGRDVVAVHDQPEIQIESERPMPFALDGDYLGETTALHLRAVPEALSVVA